MSNITNELRLAEERHDAKTAAEKALEKCKKREKKLIKQGYRYFSVGKITQILIPCDKDGNPTKEGLEKIRWMKEHLGV